MHWLFVMALLLLGLAAASGLFFLRASRARREISARLHDAALALDRRCDFLQAQVRELEERQRIDHLFDLVVHSEADGRLEADVARRLRRFVRELRVESLGPRA